MDAMNVEERAARITRTGSKINVPDLKRTEVGKVLRISVSVPGLRPGDLIIAVEGQFLRITVKRPKDTKPLEWSFDVPPEFDAARASATYLEGELHITVPKFQESAIV